MSNKKNKKKPNAQAVKANADANLSETVVPNVQDGQEVNKDAQPAVEAQAEADGKKAGKAVEVKAKDVDKKKKKDKPKKPNKVAKALKDTGSELKKVTWPKFGQVVKQTGIVLVVVIVFALVLLGLDKLCSLLVGLLN